MHTSPKMNPWKPDANPHQHRRLGKTGEEVNELGTVLFRISIQGIDEVDPSSGKTNRQRLYEEMADVQAQINKNLEFFGLHGNIAFNERVRQKMLQMDDWESHY